jgi:5-methylcytosine-specific restriction endonuclease McrA
MNSFREKDPLERDNPKAVDHYREYKSDLKEDFNSRCGYCNDTDHWSGGWRFYQLDHFIPKKYLVTVSQHEYTNLVYSCFYCNNSKRAKWPSKDEKIAIVGTEGFINPREKKYTDHLQRDKEGNIIAMSELGIYMVKSLKLKLKRHAIIWKLEKIEFLFDELQAQYEKAKDKIPEELSKKVTTLFFEYYNYTKQLRKEADA